jgi:hypothetical protein
MRLGWLIFFCCMLATFSADLFNSSLESFSLHDVFGLFQTDKFIIFKVGARRFEWRVESRAVWRAIVPPVYIPSVVL